MFSTRQSIGFFHVNIAKVQTAEGKLYLFVAIDRTPKFALAELYAKADKMSAVHLPAICAV